MFRSAPRAHDFDMEASRGTYTLLPSLPPPQPVPQAPAPYVARAISTAPIRASCPGLLISPLSPPRVRHESEPWAGATNPHLSAAAQQNINDSRLARGRGLEMWQSPTWGRRVHDLCYARAQTKKKKKITLPSPPSSLPAPCVPCLAASYQIKLVLITRRTRRTFASIRLMLVPHLLFRRSSFPPPKRPVSRPPPPPCGSARPVPSRSFRPARSSRGRTARSISRAPCGS